ncbi:hypothetical protein HPG69_004117, partial [Diceros bicornis minor]
SQEPTKKNKKRLCISKIITIVIFFLVILLTTLATILANLKQLELENVPIYTKLGLAVPVPIWLENGFAANQTRVYQEVKTSKI